MTSLTTQFGKISEKRFPQISQMSAEIKLSDKRFPQINAEIKICENQRDQRDTLHNTLLRQTCVMPNLTTQFGKISEKRFPQISQMNAEIKFSYKRFPQIAQMSAEIKISENQRDQRDTLYNTLLRQTCFMPSLTTQFGKISYKRFPQISQMSAEINLRDKRFPQISHMNAEINSAKISEISGILKQWSSMSSMPAAQLASPAMYLHGAGTQCQRRNGFQLEVNGVQ